MCFGRRRRVAALHAKGPYILCKLAAKIRCEKCYIDLSLYTFVVFTMTIILPTYSRFKLYFTRYGTYMHNTVIIIFLEFSDV